MSIRSVLYMEVICVSLIGGSMYYACAVGLAPSLCISDAASPALRAHVN